MFEYPLAAALAERAERPVQARKEDMVSPLRYPGGKAWLTRVAGAWAAATDVHGTFAELFAGGASVGLWLLRAGVVRNLILNDFDAAVSDFWHTIFQKHPAHAKKLLAMIRAFEPAPEPLAAALQEDARKTPAGHAFAVLVQNRFSSNGQLDFGKGLRKSGYSGRGLPSMWYPDTLCGRIEALLAFRGHVAVRNTDAWSARLDADAYYLDPPYPSAAKRLYAQWKTPPAATLATLSAQLGLRGPVMVSWEDRDKNRFEEAGLLTARVAMQTGKAATKYELLAFSQHAGLREGGVL